MLDPERVEPREGREARALAQVDSPYVVHLVDTREITIDAQQVSMLVMEFIEGRTLSQLVADGRLPLADVLDLSVKLAHGLAAIWAAELVHRDLKPDNVIVRIDGDPVILDLGIARHLDLETVTTPPTPGTPGWMAPEQVDLERPSRGDWRSDQFSFGLLLYVLATGYYPYQGNRLQLYLAPREQEVRRSDLVNPEISPELASAITRLMAREPYQRFLRPNQILVELERTQAALERGAKQPTIAVGRFFLAQGDRKNFATPAYYRELAPDGVICDARNMNFDRLIEFVDQTRAVNVGALVDPVNFYDRSPFDARPAKYRELPYGTRADRLLGFSSDDERAAYVQPILDYQRRTNATTLVAPYFYASGGELNWVEESLKCASESRSYTLEHGEKRDVWTAVAISQDLLRSNVRNDLLNLLTSRLPTTLYLLVHTPQGSFAPLADKDILRAITEVIERFTEARVPVVLGRRASEGLLLVALGAAGFSIGVSAIHQNFQPHPEAPAERRGQGYDWYYVPRLLNSLRMETRTDIAAGLYPEILDCNCPYCAALFGANPQATITTTEAGVLLRQHNIFAVRQQATRLAAVGPLERLQFMRTWIEEALAGYGQLPAAWAPGEGPKFLSAWLAVL